MLKTGLVSLFPILHPLHMSHGFVSYVGVFRIEIEGIVVIILFDRFQLIIKLHFPVFVDVIVDLDEFAVELLILAEHVVPVLKTIVVYSDMVFKPL